MNYYIELMEEQINGFDGSHRFDIRIPHGYGLDLDLWISTRWIMDWIWI